MTMLKVENLSVHYGMIQAVRDVSFEVNEGEVVSWLANGAGKQRSFGRFQAWFDQVLVKLNFRQWNQKVPAQKS